MKMTTAVVMSLCATFAVSSPLAHATSTGKSSHPTWVSCDVSRAQVRMFLARLTLTPETACAAGLTSADVEPLFQAGGDTLSTLAPSIQAADTAVTEARVQLATYRKAAMTVIDSSLDYSIQQAEATLASSLATQAALLNTAFDTVTAGFPQETKTILSTLRTNSGRAVPLDLRVSARSAEQWTTLENALNHVKSRTACSLTPDSGQQSVVNTASSEPAASVARQRVESNLAAVKAAWMPAQ
ncbi:MAG: hypothetical protein QM783_07325 [Phycisphaerales bacterium]